MADNTTLTKGGIGRPVYLTHVRHALAQSNRENHACVRGVLLSYVATPGVRLVPLVRSSLSPMFSVDGHDVKGNCTKYVP